MSDTNDFLKMYDDDRTKQINDMYDAQKASTMAELEGAYNQNLSKAQAAKEQINPTYQKSANDVSAAYGRTRQNNNQMAAANGLNTGAASQQAVSQSNAYMNALGQVRTAQANALNAADRGMADMEAQYKMQVAQALANNDYQRAAALFDESQNQYARSQDRAKILAGYGDFSGYAGLYGQEAADQMTSIWNTQNPDLAYQLGRISGDEYYNITGKYPIGYTPAGGGYSGGVSGTHDGELYIDGKPVSVDEYMRRYYGKGSEGSFGSEDSAVSGDDAIDYALMRKLAAEDALAAARSAGLKSDAEIKAYESAYKGNDPYYKAMDAAAREQWEKTKSSKEAIARAAAYEAKKAQDFNKYWDERKRQVEELASRYT